MVDEGNCAVRIPELEGRRRRRSRRRRQGKEGDDADFANCPRHKAVSFSSSFSPDKSAESEEKGAEAAATGGAKKEA